MVDSSVQMNPTRISVIDFSIIIHIEENKPMSTPNLKTRISV